MYTPNIYAYVVIFLSNNIFLNQFPFLGLEKNHSMKYYLTDHSIYSLWSRTLLGEEQRQLHLIKG